MTQKQVQKFRIKLDMSKAYKDIKSFKLREYNGVFPTIQLTASNPDQACFLALNNLVELLRSQNVSEELIFKIRNLISVKSLQHEH